MELPRGPKPKRRRKDAVARPHKPEIVRPPILSYPEVTGANRKPAICRGLDYFIYRITPDLIKVAVDLGKVEKQRGRPYMINLAVTDGRRLCKYVMFAKKLCTINQMSSWFFKGSSVQRLTFEHGAHFPSTHEISRSHKIVPLDCYRINYIVKGPGGSQRGGNKPGLKKQKRANTAKKVQKKNSGERKRAKPEAPSSLPSLAEEFRAEEHEPPVLPMKVPVFPKDYLCFCSNWKTCPNQHFHPKKPKEPAQASEAKPEKKSSEKGYRRRMWKNLIKLPCTNPDCTHDHFCSDKRVKTPETNPEEIPETPILALQVQDEVVAKAPALPAGKGVAEKISEKKADYRLVPAHQIGEKKYQARNYEISSPAYKSLVKKFPNPHLSHSISDVCLASLRKSFPDLDITIALQTVLYHIATTYVYQQALRDESTTALVLQSHLQKNEQTATYVAPSSLDYQDYVLGLGRKLDHGQFTRTYACASSLPQKMGTNNNFEVISSVGWTAHDATTPELGMFATTGNPKPKFYKTVWFRITGLHDFQVLDANGDNYVKAMYRLFRCRTPVKELSPAPGSRLRDGPCEQELRTNQLRLLNHAPYQQRLMNAVSRTPLVIPPDNDPTGSLVRRYATTCVLSCDGARRVLYQTLLFGVLYQISTYFFTFLNDAFQARLHYVVYGSLVTIMGTLAFRRLIKHRLYSIWFWGRTTSLARMIHSYEVPIPVRAGEVKFKKEFAKPGKHGRLFVSYGKSILTTGWIFSWFKKAFCSTYTFRGGSLLGFGQTDAHIYPLRLQVVKQLDEGCTPNLSPSNGLSARAFSDDMELLWRDTYRGKQFDIDIDISGCDAGNTSAVFYLLGTLLIRFGMAWSALEQSYKRLTSKLLCRNPSNASEKLIIIPKTIYQGSGCPETTVVNNVSSTLIICAIHCVILLNLDLWSNGSDEDRTGLINYAAGCVGHQVSVDHRKTPQERQFLKYSPFQDQTGSWIFSRNLGAILRGLGSCDGDVQARHLGATKSEFRAMSHEEKGELFTRGVITGLKNEPGNCILDALRARFGTSSSYLPIISNIFTRNSQDRSGSYIATSELMLRYGGTHEEWADLCGEIKDLRYGQRIRSPLVTRIMHVDYGTPAE